MQVSSHASYLHSPLPNVAAAPQTLQSANDRAHELVKPVGEVSSGISLDSQRRNSAGAGDEPSSTHGNENESKAEGKEQAQKTQEERQALLDQQTVKELSARDREVRAHEQAHMAVGGQYAGSASYTYERGPNGVNYAVGGEVPISTGREATPEQTIRKAQIVKRAAMAPAEPSSADRQVAAAASQLEANAKRELMIEMRRDAEQDKKDVDTAAQEAAKSERRMGEKPTGETSASGFSKDGASKSDLGPTQSMGGRVAQDATEASPHQISTTSVRHKYLAQNYLHSNNAAGHLLHQLA